MTDDLVLQISQALHDREGRIKHAPDCETSFPDTMMDTWTCTCDIAERRELDVARAIAAAVGQGCDLWGTWGLR